MVAMLPPPTPQHTEAQRKPIIEVTANEDRMLPLCPHYRTPGQAYSDTVQLPARNFHPRWACRVPLGPSCTCRCPLSLFL